MSTLYGLVNVSKNIDTECVNNCHWGYLLNEKLRITLQNANFNTGIATMLIGLWLNFTILMSKKMRNEKSYRNLLTYTISASLRRAAPVVALIFPFKRLIDCFAENMILCKFMGSLDSFIAVFEMESLAQVCIERFINAAYTYRGWYIPDWYNNLFIYISILLAFLYSLVPVLIGYHNTYGKDFDCVNCTFNILLPEENAYKLIFIIFFAMKTIKPVITMIISLRYARWIELNKIKDGDQNSADLSRSICIVVAVNIIFWFPIFVVRSSVIMIQILFKSTELLWTSCFVAWALSMHWCATMFALFGLICFNSRLRAKMLSKILLRPIDSDEQAQAPIDKPEGETKDHIN